MKQATSLESKDTMVNEIASIEMEKKIQNSKSGPLPVTVWLLGFIMFLINTSFMMIYSLSGIYLKSAMGVNTNLISILEGVAEGASYAFKLLSGVASDYLRRRKAIMVVGYGLMVISRPVLAISNTFLVVLGARLMERLGNGIQATPRDALVGDVAPTERRGAAYGLMRSLGTAGSCFGAIVAIFAMWWTLENFRQVFWLATIPAILAYFILISFVKEPERNVHPKDHQKRHPIHFTDIPRLGKSYWILMIVVGIFILSRVSETILVLHAHDNYGLSSTYAPLVMIVFNLCYSLSSYPIGRLSDRIGRYGLMSAGISALICADVLLAFAPNIYVMFVGVMFWGVQWGISMSVFMAFIADTTPEDLRGTAFGFYYLISAVASVMAGIIAGTISHGYGLHMTFMVSSVIAILALLVLVLFLPRPKKAR